MTVLLLPVVLLILLVLIAGVTALVVLLANPKTRAAGAVVLAVLLAIVLLVMGIAAVGLFAYRQQVVVRQHAEMAQLTRQVETARAAEAMRRRAAKPVLPAPSPEPPAPSPEPPAPGRPAWVEAPSRRVGDAYQKSIMVGPFTTRLECDARLPAELQVEAEDYIETCLGREAAARVRLPADELRRQLVKEVWQETGRFSVGPMTQLHVLLEFDRAFRNRVDEEWRQLQIHERLWYAGTALGGGLFLMTVVWAGLKLDERMGAARHGRLALAAVAALRHIDPARVLK